MVPTTANVANRTEEVTLSNAGVAPEPESSGSDAHHWKGGSWYGPRWGLRSWIGLGVCVEGEAPP